MQFMVLNVQDAFEELGIEQKKGDVTVEPRTQKAKGLVALQKYKANFKFLEDAVRTLQFRLVSEESDFEDPYLTIGPNTMARPCPVKPAHGFVDSRPVNNKAEALKVWKEARKADPKAEMLLMPYIKSSHNAIWTTGVLTVGQGNDGATGGKAAASIRTTDKSPLAHDEKVERAILTEAGVKEGDAPYLEFVQNEKRDAIYLVQLRSGPKVSGLGPDFVPKTVTVTKIEKPRGDLLEWKEICAKFKAGTVVVHPGGALSSHWGVHCVDNGIPYVTTPAMCSKVKVGETLKKIPVEIPQKDVEEVLKGIAYGVTYQIGYREAAMLVLGALHNSAYFGKQESRLYGVAVMLALKLGFAACFGEARHKQKHGLARHQVYDKAWANLRESVQKFNEIRKKFYEKGWRPGYGGKAWGKCSDATADLWNATVRFVREKTPEALKNVNEALNVMINCAHNNGWWFNKFIYAGWFDIAAQSPASPLIAIMHHVYQISTAPAEFNGLMAEVEKASESAKTKRGRASTDQLPSKDTPREYGPFKIVYMPSGKPWFVTFPDGSQRRCAGLWGVAKLYLEIMKKEVTDEARTEVFKHLQSELGKPGKGVKGDTWIIPDLDTTTLGKEKVTAAAATIKSNMLHVQIKTEGGVHYQTMNVPVTKELQEAIAKAKPIPSFSGSGDVYAALEVQKDGVYLGEHKVVPLKNYLT
ncbi:MAG TPA: hypothetical protein VNL14_16540 [Candidatus Acidoferrales bacterium]|nr:hypothetical protein [Candidatus Acidoferrales bacterium]